MPRARLNPLIAILALVAVAAFAVWRPAATPDNPESDTRIVFIVRHGDTDPAAGRDPDLTEQGRARAARLARVLADEPLGAVYVTDTARSRQTAVPLAGARGIEPGVYPATDTESLSDSIQALPEGAGVLVVAHSNTVPMLIARLGGPKLPDLAHDDFSRLYAVVLQDGRHIRTIELRY